MTASFENYFQQMPRKLSKGSPGSYMKTHYDVTRFMKGKMLPSENLPNILVRLKNALITGINEQVLLPKAILIVLDDDLMDSLGHYQEGFSLSIGKLMEWLANELHDIICKHKEKLPSRSRKFKYPAVLWCTIPLHMVYGQYNDFKTKFNRSLEKTVLLFREMETLKIQWEDKNMSFFQGGCISPFGLRRYWEAINKAFESWDKDQMKAMLLALQRNTSPTAMAMQHDKNLGHTKYQTGSVHRPCINDGRHCTSGPNHCPEQRIFKKPLVPYK